MEEKRAAPSRVKVRLASIENTLKRKLALCINVLPNEDPMKFLVSPSPSMNSTFDEAPSFQSTPLTASTVGRNLGRQQ